MGDGDLLARLVAAAAAAIGGRAAELDALDAATGDGDHGTNLARGLAAAAARARDLAGLPPGVALRAAGAALGEAAGGDGGRLYAALLRGMADGAPDGGRPGLAALARMLDAGVAAVRAEGGARAGDKTLLDVLEPVAHALRAGLAEARAGGDVGSRALAAAAFGLHRTSRLAARHGLAAGLGAASVNHLDPGACSAALVVGAVVGELESAAAG